MLGLCLGLALLYPSDGAPVANSSHLTGVAVVATVILVALLVSLTQLSFGFLPSVRRLPTYVLAAASAYALLSLFGSVLRRRSVVLPMSSMLLLSLLALAFAFTGVAVSGHRFGALLLGLTWGLVAISVGWGAYLEAALGPGKHARIAGAMLIG